MSAFGLDKHFFTDLQFLNEQHSIIFGLIYFSIFVYLGGWAPTLISTIGGLIIALGLQRFVINPRQPVPKGAALVISGCSSGIGKAAATHFAQQGFNVFATVRKESDGKILLAGLPNGLPGTITPLIVDVTNQQQITQGAAIVKNFLQKNNIGFAGVINNAGYSESVFLELTTQDQIKKQYSTNVFGLRNFTNAFLPLMREFSINKINPKLNPKVIIVSSALTKQILPGYGLYASTKLAVERFVDAYRQELSPLNIDVVSVIPGLIATQFQANTKRQVLEGHGTEPIENDKIAKMQYYADAQDFLSQQEKQSSEWATDPQIVVDIFQESLLSPRPLARYMAGRDCHGMNMMSKFPSGIMKYFPIFKKYFGVYYKVPTYTPRTTSTTATTSLPPAITAEAVAVAVAAPAPPAPVAAVSIVVPKPVEKKEEEEPIALKQEQSSEPVLVDDVVATATVAITPQEPQPGEELLRRV